MTKYKMYKSGKKLVIGATIVGATLTAGMLSNELQLPGFDNRTNVAYADFKADNPNGNILSNGVLTDVTSGKSAAAGGTLDIDNIGDTIQLEYQWKLDSSTGYQYKAGDTFTFEVPDQLRVANEVSFPLTTADGVTLGTVHVSMDGTATITFS